MVLKATHPNANAPSLTGRRVLVIGLGRFGGGVGVTRWLIAQGAKVAVTDSAPAETLRESVEAVADLGVQLILGSHDGIDLSNTDLVVVNPAVRKKTSALFRAVADAGVAWTTEMNLFCERCPAPVVGVTGTYGKSTTCVMLAAALEALRVSGTKLFNSVHLGGNIGRSLLGDLDKIRASDLVILEMSNAQLEDLPRIEWRPATAVITNIEPHHLDRYESFREYVDAKLNIVRGGGTAKVIVGALHREAEAMLAGVIGEKQELLRVVQPEPPVVLRVPGRHNRTNAACVLTICRALGVDERIARGAMGEFRGLPHRLEVVRTLNGVTYIDDSKSTAPATTVTAVESITEGDSDATSHRTTVAIVGGECKNVSLTEVARALASSCKAVICTGASGPAFAAAVRCETNASAEAKKCVVVETDDLEGAVAAAQIRSAPGDTILFSPGAPSFDGYGNFAERGEHFAELVRSL
ncbi:MAG: UDP-N-acetylmuramoyl-L-alanine--D-glutamate ligase [Planctomycetes bacterium]|nr:UDP-N-acetylmuramoyl-L-alanine--D-glutamate ligase [Planctomycetota bacterium]